MASYTFCNDTSERQILHKIKRLLLLINQTQWIIEAYVSDFYTHQHWEKLSHCIQEYVDATEPPDWAWLLDTTPADTSSKPKATRTVIPLALLALKSCTQHLSLERIAMDLDQAETMKKLLDVLQHKPSSKKACLDEKLAGGTGSDVNEKASMNQNVSAKAFQKPNYKNGQCMDMKHIFRKHVKPKKQHEIQRLGQVIHFLSQSTNCKLVIDVGAGLGHLSRLLTFSHNLKVMTIEAADSHAPKATEFDREMKKDVLKKLRQKHQGAINKNDATQEETPCSSNQNPETESECLTAENSNVPPAKDWCQDSLQEANLPSHVVCFIEPQIAASQFLDILQNAKSKVEPHSVPGEDSFILAGLHTCGDLTPTLLKVFVTCPSATALALVGCCYMKMNACVAQESSSVQSASLENYPLSAFIKEQGNYTLSYESREMACHFADAYCQRLKDNPIDLKIHSYRAALQYLIKTVSPDFASGQLRLVCKKGAQLPFAKYASEVLKKLDMDLQSVPEALVKECEDMAVQWKRVVAFYTIRLSLAPAVEALILLDRVLFLKDMGINSALVPIFDSKLSPRNFVLLAIK